MFVLRDEAALAVQCTKVPRLEERMPSLSFKFTTTVRICCLHYNKNSPFRALLWLRLPIRWHCNVHWCITSCRKWFPYLRKEMLKGQEPPKLTGAIVWKALEGKLLTYFKVFQGLKVGKLTLCIKINNMLCTYTLLYIMQPKSWGRPWEQGYFGLLSNPKLDSGMEAVINPVKLFVKFSSHHRAFRNFPTLQLC